MNIRFPVWWTEWHWLGTGVGAFAIFIFKAYTDRIKAKLNPTIDGHIHRAWEFFRLPHPVEPIRVEPGKITARDYCGDRVNYFGWTGDNDEIRVFALETRWKWASRMRGIREIHVFCPRCQTRMTSIESPDIRVMGFSCPKDLYRVILVGSNYAICAHVAEWIDRRLQSGEWRQAVEERQQKPKE